MNKNVKRLVESAVLIAVATVLSLLSFKGPWIKGGSITLCSMLPLVIISFRYGSKWGMVSAFTYAVLQAILGASNLGYAPNFAIMLLILVFDYLFPFTIIGLSSIFEGKIKNKILAIIVGIILTFSIRFISHFLMGWLVWQSLWPEAGWIPWVYSLAYNASYMLPEIVITSIISTISYKPLQQYWNKENLA